MKPERYEALKAKIVEANPELAVKQCDCPYCEGVTRTHGDPHTLRPISLADVLLALDKLTEARHRISINVTGRICHNGLFTEQGDHPCGDWNLRADSLDDQSDETKRFLATLLLP